MSNQLSNISKNSALLVMDFQTIILNKIGHLRIITLALTAAGFLPQESAGNVIRNTASLIAAARTAGVPVIYVSVGFRKGIQRSAKTTRSFLRLKRMEFLWLTTRARLFILMSLRQRMRLSSLNAESELSSLPNLRWFSVLKASKS